MSTALIVLGIVLIIYVISIILLLLRESSEKNMKELLNDIEKWPKEK